MHIAGHAYSPLTPEQLGRLHNSALTILAEMGMVVEHHGLLDELAASGLLVDHQTCRVTFPTALVERFIADAPKHDWETAKPRVAGSAGVYAGRYHDPVTRDLVPWNEEHLAHYFTLARRLPHVGGASMLGCPLGVPGSLEPLFERYYCWKYGAGESGSLHIDALCPYILELYERLAAEQGVPPADVFKGAVYLIPALKLGRHEAHQVVYFREHGLKVSIGQSMATMGATAPVTLAGAVALNLAEQLALNILDWALFGDVHLHLGCSLAAMDMRTTIRPFGRPEMAMANVLTAQLARYYGATFSGHAGLSDAKMPSVEAGAQKALSAIPTLLTGGSLWMDVGLLATDEVCSPIQMVLDNELLSALGHFTREVTVDEEAIGLADILEAGPGGQYLDRYHTARHFKDAVWEPTLWSRHMLGPWLAGARELDVDRAREIVLEMQYQLGRETQEPGMSESLEAAILGVIARAGKALGIN